MKATTTAIDCAKSAKNALNRVQAAMEEAIKRLAQLNQEEKQPRTQAAIEQIQMALKTSELVHHSLRRIALQSLALDPMAMIELEAGDLASLSYGLEK